MATIEIIKQKLVNIDAGTFQNLCDAYLVEKGHKNIMSLGSCAGTRKTTPGTPDSYFYTTDKKYVFVEYTTQKESLFRKIKDDITKCLDEVYTGIEHKEIEEIKYYHTSSNIKPGQDKELREMCEKVGIKLSLMGVDALAAELFFGHEYLVCQFLGIEISTGQIQTIADFVREYNANAMAAPIDTEFLYRAEEVEQVKQGIEEVEVVLLKGAAGTGKTRLALYIAEAMKSDTRKCYVIRSKNLSLVEDMKRFFSNPGEYFIVIDDANQLSSLSTLIQYISGKPNSYNIKVLITVRDYAEQKVINTIREIVNYKTIEIDKFADDEIKAILEKSLNIFNQRYQEQIIRIAEGNVRIAVLAGKIACEKGDLNAIRDASQLYDIYYGEYVKVSERLQNKEVLIT